MDFETVRDLDNYVSGFDTIEKAMSKLGYSRTYYYKLKEELSEVDRGDINRTFPTVDELYMMCVDYAQNFDIDGNKPHWMKVWLNRAEGDKRQHRLIMDTIKLVRNVIE